MGIFQRSIYSVSFEDIGSISEFLENQKFLFHRHALGKILWLIDISTELLRNSDSDKPEWNEWEEW